jgi:hypothetical protein
MKLSLKADGIEATVNKTEVSLICPNCEHSFAATPVDLLRDAELVADESRESTQAKEAFISYYQTGLTCAECELPFPVDFAYGEMQPARYLFGLYE